MDSSTNDGWSAYFPEPAGPRKIFRELPELCPCCQERKKREAEAKRERKRLKLARGQH